jgi:transposase
MTKNNQFSSEVRQRATHLVFESQHEYSSQWAAICSVAQKIGCSPETLRAWIRRQEHDVLVKLIRTLFSQPFVHSARATTPR